jgi:hypothetical protein
MSAKDKKPVNNEGELSDQQLDKVAGGQEVRKMETIYVTAKREKPANENVVKMGTVTVTATRDKQPSTQVASVDTTKKN